MLYSIHQDAGGWLHQVFSSWRQNHIHVCPAGLRCRRGCAPCVLHPAQLSDLSGADSVVRGGRRSVWRAPCQVRMFVGILKAESVQIQYAFALIQNAWRPLGNASAGIHSMLPFICFLKIIELLRHSVSCGPMTIWRVSPCAAVRVLAVAGNSRQQCALDVGL